MKDIRHTMGFQLNVWRQDYAGVRLGLINKCERFAYKRSTNRSKKVQREGKTLDCFSDLGILSNRGKEAIPINTCECPFRKAIVITELQQYGCVIHTPALEPKFLAYFA